MIITKLIDFDKLLEVLEEKAEEIQEELEQENIVRLQKDVYWNKQMKILVWQDKKIRLTKKERYLFELLFSAPLGGLHLLISRYFKPYGMRLLRLTGEE